MDIRRRNFLRGKLSSSTDIRLPWIKSKHQFHDDCTRCAKCIDACQENIVRKGDGGFPGIDFRFGECTFCGDCADACPEGLFSADRTELPWLYKAVITNSCLSRQGVTCRSCQDSCESGAIHFLFAQGGMAYPAIAMTECTGCGACVKPCPTQAVNIEEINVNMTKESACL